MAYGRMLRISWVRVDIPRTSFFLEKCSPNIGQWLLLEEFFQPSLPAFFHF